jgi:hypothetical protein
LVPLAKNWRTGTNENTTVSFGDDVIIIGGKTLKKGKYTLYTIQNDRWEVVFYSTTDNWGTPHEI